MYRIALNTSVAVDGAAFSETATAIETEVLEQFSVEVPAGTPAAGEKVSGTSVPNTKLFFVTIAANDYSLGLNYKLGGMDTTAAAIKLDGPVTLMKGALAMLPGTLNSVVFHNPSTKVAKVQITIGRDAN